MVRNPDYPDFKSGTGPRDVSNDWESFNEAKTAILSNWEALCVNKQGKHAFTSDFTQLVEESFRDVISEHRPEYIVYSKASSGSVIGFAILKTKYIRNKVPHGIELFRARKKTSEDEPVVMYRENGEEHLYDAYAEDLLADRARERRRERADDDDDTDVVDVYDEDPDHDDPNFTSTLYVTIICSVAGKGAGKHIMDAIKALGKELRNLGLIESISLRAANPILKKNVYKKNGFKEEVVSEKMPVDKRKDLLNELNAREPGGHHLKSEYHAGRWMSLKP